MNHFQPTRRTFVSTLLVTGLLSATPMIYAGGKGGNSGSGSGGSGAGAGASSGDQAQDRDQDCEPDKDQDRDRDRDQDCDNVADQDKDRDRDRDRLQADDGTGTPIFGSDVMSEGERNEYRNRIMNAGSNIKRQSIRKEHQLQIRERATQLGVILPEA